MQVLKRTRARVCPDNMGRKNQGRYGDKQSMRPNGFHNKDLRGKHH